MRSLRSVFAIPLLLLILSCGTDYPPIPQTVGFSADREASFSLPPSVTPNKDTVLLSLDTIDTNAYDKQGTTASLLQTAEVWHLTLQSSDPNYSLDKLGAITVLVGPDTVGFDPMPSGTIDTTLTLTKTDLTKVMQGTTFTASLLCHPIKAPSNTVTITCAMTVVFSADYPI